MHGLPVHMHGAGAAIAGIAALFHPEMAHAAQKRPQALTGARLYLRCDAIHVDQHAGGANSRRMSSASSSVMWRRQSGRPWTSLTSKAGGIAEARRCASDTASG